MWQRPSSCAPDGSFLMARRPPGKLYAGYWEFPGGKIEPGEAPAAAIARELHEELGIDIGTACPWITRVFEYPHGTVHLRFFRVFEWQGEPHPREGQDIGWQTLDKLVVRADAAGERAGARLARAALGVRGHERLAGGRVRDAVPAGEAARGAD